MPRQYSRHGRRTPYTEQGIRRLPCFRCGDKALHQWQICADDRLYRPICKQCDLELNIAVMEWMGFPDKDIDKKIAKYRESLNA